MSGLHDSGAAGRPHAEPEPAAPSRRSVLRGAAGAGAAGLAVTALGGIAAPASASARTLRSAAASKPADDSQPAAADATDAVVVHVRDARTGEIDVFRGATQTRVHDRELAARLVRASK